MSSDSFAEEDLQQLLEEVARENGFEEPRYEVSAATKAGDNYIGRILRAVVYEDGPVDREPLPLIFKVAPSSKARRETFRSGLMFCNEGNMYTKVLPALNSFLQEHGLSDSDTYPGSARCLTVRLSEDASENAEDVLVLEDMRAKGFAMVDRSIGLTADACRMIFRNLARLHATSLALRQLKPEEAAQVESNIREVAFEEGNALITEMKPVIAQSINFFEDNFPEGTPEHTKLQEFIDRYYDDLIQMIAPNDALCCITHGDCWSNNVLFKFDEDDQLEDVCLIDFQISRMASPILDLVYLIFTCTTKQTRDEHYESLLRSYHEEATNILTSLGCDAEEIFSWDLFQDQLKVYGRYGLAMALLTTPLFLADSADVPDLDESMEHDVSLKNIFLSINANKKGEEIKERLRDVLLDCIELGYF